MSVLGDLFEELGIAREKILEIVTEMKKNPMGAMTMLQELNLSRESNQKIMEIVMMLPAAVDELAAELGLSPEIVDSIRQKINPLQRNEQV